MKMEEKPPDKNTSSVVSTDLQEELDRRLFHLTTLYDVSRELIGVSDVDTILKSFLMMTTGNFGVIEGFLMTWEPTPKEIVHFTSVGLEDHTHPLLTEIAKKVLNETEQETVLAGSAIPRALPFSSVSSVCLLPFEVDKDCRGLLGLGAKLTDKPYSKEDGDLLKTLLNNLVISLKNAKYSEALVQAYDEVSSLNRAKDKAINHLSHELKTPIALLKACFTSLRKKLAGVPVTTWQSVLDRGDRSLQRLSEIQDEVEDIMEDREYKSYHLLGRLLELCADGVEILVSEQGGESRIIERVRNRIEELFSPKENVPEDIPLEPFVLKIIEEMRPCFSHRNVHLDCKTKPSKTVYLPSNPLRKVVWGMIRNAVENTPDEGKIEVSVGNNGSGVSFIVHDYGVGIRPDHQKRIFEGFFPTQETNDYTSGQPFDFNAGGKGADLLRMKIFSERFRFNIAMTSTRCRHITDPGDHCPGLIDLCEHCTDRRDCYQSGGTIFEVFFPDNFTNVAK